MKNKIFLLGILAIMLVLGMTVVGCETDDGKGALGGTTWTRSVKNSSYEMTWDIIFVDASKAKIHQTGWEMVSGKKTNRDVTTEYTYDYDSKVNVNGWQGVLTPKSGNNEILFKISGSTLTTQSSSGSSTYTKK